VSEASTSPLGVILIAIAGLLVAAALGAAAGNLTTRPVGISAEAVSVGEELVAKDRRASRHRQHGRARSARARRRPDAGGDSAAASAPAIPTPIPVAPAAPAPTSNSPAGLGDSDSGAAPGDGGGGSTGGAGREPSEQNGGAERAEDEHGERDDD
jgi:uncharacterized membrane protein YgcG